MHVAYIPRFADIKVSLSGDLESFKKMKNCTQKVIEMTLVSAIRNGNIDTIEHIVRNGLVDVSDKPYCDIATKHGQYECLRYLHENGCKFNKYTALIAMIRSDYNCLSYIVQNGGALNMPV